MKNITQIYSFFFLFVLNSNSQKLSGIVKYTETLQLGNKIERNNILYFDSNSSFFEKVEQTSLENLSSEKQSLYNKCKRITYLNFNTKEYYFSYAVGLDNTLVKDSFVMIDWKLLPDTKKIGNFNCQKAVGKFRGRNYNVWFTPEIPVQFGPWKIFGLPGLILEVTEENNVYHAIATDIVLDENVLLLIESKVIETDLNKAITFKAYKKKIAKSSLDYKKLVQSKMPKGEKVLWQDDAEKSKPLEILD